MKEYEQARLHPPTPITVLSGQDFVPLSAFRDGAPLVLGVRFSCEREGSGLLCCPLSALCHFSQSVFRTFLLSLVSSH